MSLRAVMTNLRTRAGRPDTARPAAGELLIAVFARHASSLAERRRPRIRLETPNRYGELPIMLSGAFERVEVLLGAIANDRELVRREHQLAVELLEKRHEVRGRDALADVGGEAGERRRRRADPREAPREVVDGLANGGGGRMHTRNLRRRRRAAIRTPCGSRCGFPAIRAANRWIWSADQREPARGGQAVERVLHASGDEIVGVLGIGVGPELVGQVDRREDVDRDLGRKRYADREVEDGEPQGRCDLD